ncbi:MAG: hypothetical protein WCJ84_02185 [Candidatus Peregrinibacteria bacterium]
MSLFALDIGGSTIDLVEIDSDTKAILSSASLESGGRNKNNLSGILPEFLAFPKILKNGELVITGGHSRFFPKTEKICGITITLQMVHEFEAIARGGLLLSGKTEGLVISLGTGTAMVSAQETQWTHVRGTGIGGGTFLGLGRALLGSDSFEELRALSEQGDIARIDLSVGEIVGGDLDGLSADATASHFAKYSPEYSRKEDIALGIARLVGQGIALLALEKAKNYHHQNIILGGKLTRLTPVVALIRETGEMFGKNILLPPHADILTAIGAAYSFLDS